MDIIKAIIFGIIEGITEWLPISSTGHLILAEHFIGFQQSEAFKEMFEVVIQLGAILSVLVLYFHKINPFSKKKTPKEIQHTWKLWLKIVIACLPAAIIGLPLNDWLNKTFYNFVSVAIMLIVYGVLFIVVERTWVPSHEPVIRHINQLPYKVAFLIGAFQVLALIPGTSRSGATIIGALLLGTNRAVAAEFAFFLGIPVMFGASGLKVFRYFLQGNTLDVFQFFVLMIACLVAFFVSMATIRFLMDYVKKHDFTWFGKYRIALGAVLLAVAGITALIN